MDRIARASTGERRLVFEAAAQRMALTPAVVEKDFWVCYTLDHLFHRSGFAESMVFKGGTSLSKAFGLIERFSEDIDLILDWRLLGYGEDEPWEPRSNSAQERFKADSIERTNAFLADAFVPKLRATLSESLGTEASVRCGAEEETVYFDYPRSYESAGTLDTIKLEIGPMAAWSPSEEAAITPYAADVVPFGPELSTTVRTASPERTFWEKATILHQEANRPEGKAMPRRYSRHYYDMYRLGHSFVLGCAVAQPGLLEQVVRFKEKFYRTPWAKLADARPRRGRSRERPSIPSLPAGARSSRMQRASRRRWERRPASAIPTIHGSGAPTRTPMAFSGTGSRRARASTMSATARCRRHAIHSTGDHASVSSGSAPGRSTTTSRCTCSEDSSCQRPYLLRIPPQLLVGWARDAACGTRHPCASESSWGERGLPRSSCAGCA